MTRAIAKLLTKADAAIATAQRRIRPNVMDRLTPTARRMAEAWIVARSPAECFEALLNGTHILSTADIWDDPDIPADASLTDLMEMYERVRNDSPVQ